MKFYEPPFEKNLPDFLDPHQREGVRWILSRSRSYLAHAPGAGKTCEAIVAAKLNDQYPVLFVVPPTLTLNWRREIRKWEGLLKRSEMPVQIIPESSRKGEVDWESEFIICPDSLLTKSWVLEKLMEMEFRFVAIDEASRFKEHTAQRTIALFGGTLKNRMKSKGVFQYAKHGVLLDGSPIPNRPMEIWAPTYAMCPEALDRMGYYSFGFKYCGAIKNSFGKWEFRRSSNEALLRHKLQEHFMHVVTEEELSHPERLRSLVFLNQDLRTEAQKTWEAKNLSRVSKISGENDSQGDFAKWRHELGLKKVPFVVRYVQEKIDKGESILLFAWHLDVIDRLVSALKSAAKIDGRTPMGSREDIFKEFQLGNLKILVGNILAMGRGHNLQKANRVVFAEYSWCDEANKQAEKRVSRKGNSQKHTRCDYLVISDSLDETILRSIMRKAKTIKSIIS